MTYRAERFLGGIHGAMRSSALRTGPNGQRGRGETRPGRRIMARCSNRGQLISKEQMPLGMDPKALLKMLDAAGED